MNSMLSMMVLLLVCLTGLQEARAEGIKEGKWSITIVTRAAGMDQQLAESQEAMQDMSPEEQGMMQQMMGGMQLGNQGMTTTVTQCITSADPVPQANPEEGCQETHSMNGNAVHFESVCSGSTSSGDISYDNDSMQGTINSQSSDPGTPAVTIEMSGQYVGPCE